METQQNFRIGGLLALIVLLAAVLRLWGLTYDLPYIYHPDEPINLGVIQRMVQTANPNPQFFNYPSLFIYLNVIAYGPCLLIKQLLGQSTTILLPQSLTLGVTIAQQPATVVLGRLVSLAFGLGTVVLTYGVGYHLWKKPAIGLLAAGMVAVAPATVGFSRLITPDIFVVFWALAAVWGAVAVYQQGKTWQYVVAGLCVGLTISSKYNGGLVVLPLLVAHFLRHGKAGLGQITLYLALMLVAVGFVATTPFAILDFDSFSRDFEFERQHYASGHPGMEGNALGWYLAYAWHATGGVALLLAVAGGIVGAMYKPKETAIVGVFVGVYFGFISSLVVRNDRTFLPLLPFLFWLAAFLIVFTIEKVSALPRSHQRGLLQWGLVGFAVVALSLPLYATIGLTQRLTATDSRTLARAYIDETFAPGTKIALEGYGPYLDPQRFEVVGFNQLNVNSAEWYRAEGFAVLVFGQGMYGRFYAEPERYAAVVSQYDALFAAFDPPVAVFNEQNYEVRVYVVR